MKTSTSTNAFLVEDAAAKKAVEASQAVKDCKELIKGGGYFAEMAAAELPGLLEAEHAAQAAYRALMQSKTYNTVLDAWV